MNIFFKKLNKSDYIFDINQIVVGENYKIKYYDEYKYLHFLDGKCIEKKKIINTYFILLYSKTRGLYFSFFMDSPLVISIEKVI